MALTWLSVPKSRSAVLLLLLDMSTRLVKVIKFFEERDKATISITLFFEVTFHTNRHI
jgi:hypothetical protein